MGTKDLSLKEIKQQISSSTEARKKVQPGRLKHNNFPTLQCGPKSSGQY